MKRPFGDITPDTKKKPTRCNPASWKHWIKIDKQCPKCGHDHAFFWSDFSEGLVCASMDCDWDWLPEDSWCDEVFGKEQYVEREEKEKEKTEDIKRAIPILKKHDIDGVFDG